MDLTIDTNHHEGDLFAGLTELAPKRERLDLGDVRLSSPTTVVYLERKTFADLCGSIADGRYAEQKKRFLEASDLDNEREHHFVYLLVERTIPRWNGRQPRGFPNQNAFAALLKTQLRDRIPVVWTTDSEDACRTITYLYTQLRDNKLHISTCARQADASVRQRKRKCAGTDPLLAMLASVDGASLPKAEALVAEFGTLARLLDAEPTAIANVKVGKRRLGDALARAYTRAFHGA